jgi:hypothetical protein
MIKFGAYLNKADNLGVTPLEYSQSILLIEDFYIFVSNITL